MPIRGSNWHIYFFGICFFILAFVFIKLLDDRRKQSRHIKTFETYIQAERYAPLQNLPVRVSYKDSCRDNWSGPFLSERPFLDGRHKILASLEPLFPNSSFRSGAGLSIDDIGSGKTVELKLPPGVRTSLWGLFLCSDAANTGECKSKPWPVRNKILKNPKASAKNDKVYFFQHLIIEDGDITIYPRQSWDADVHEIFLRYLAKRMGLTYSKARFKILSDYLINQHQHFQPASLQATRWAFDVNFTRHRASVCTPY